MKKLTILLSNLLIASMLFGQVNIIDDSFYSEVLGQNMMVDVFLPPDYEVNPDQYYPLVYYLHGFGGNQNNLVFYAPTANNLMLNGSIDPFIMVCANNQAGPFGGTMYMNSPLWGDFETYNFTEVVNHIEANYRAIPEKNKRALMGQSMGAAGCFENGPKYKNKFRAIAAHGYSGVMEHCLDDWQTALLNEQVSGPPYFFDFYSGEIFTKLCFLQSGAVAPNLTSPQTYINPTTVEFILDDQGAFIDTVVSKWLAHSGHKLVQGLTPEDDFGILFGCGQNDELLFYQGAAALKDSLDAYGIPSQFFSHNGSHAMPASFKVEAYTFLDSIFNIESNSCLPEGITFTTQEEIDNFQINYPGCNEIEGDVVIGGTFYGTNIQNLDSLIQISAILGSLEIFTNFLTDLTGLDGLLSVGGNLKINYNDALTSLSGLENIESVGGDLKIVDNDMLTNLIEWNNLEIIGGNLVFAHNDNLVSLSGFENLNSIGGTLNIQNNDALVSLSGLDNLTTIENLYIEGNDILPSLSGLENLEFISGNFTIGWTNGNNILLNLEGLEGLTSIPGNVIIKLNESLTDLSGLDNLTSIQGNVEIKYHGSLTGLTGFENLNYIGGNLELAGNLLLDDLSALTSLDTIDSSLIISSNPILNNLEGLENLLTLGGDLHIGAPFSGNDGLINLIGLNGLTEIYGSFMVESNSQLNSLEGLSNLVSIGENLIILNNNSLSDCEIEAVCNFLSNPNGNVSIYNNAEGCNNPPQVASACNITLPCLPYGNYYFKHQEEIDNFQENYQGCTEIMGSMHIGTWPGVNTISNLEGLNGITIIEEDLVINESPNLTDLAGLNNLTSIGGKFVIRENDFLLHINDLENLAKIGDKLFIYNNISLQSLEGLDGIDTIQENLTISGNELISSLEGLNNLKHVAGSFYLGQCFSALYSLEGLNNLSSVLGDVKILGNGKLNIFSGLESLDSIGGDMTVEGNSSLINFEGLNNLSNINGLFSVRYNDSILNFSGFDNLISTGGLEVVSNTSLINFEGLEGLSIINGNTVIGKGGYYFSNGNPALTTLNGLDNLSYINGSLSVEYNNVLDNLTGLIALDSINGPIFITHNDTLSSLSGLDNISAGSIGYLTISQNDDLNNCAVQSICDYLTIPGAIVNINNNADGCNDTTQVNEACLGVSIEDININNKAILFPNPVIDFAHLSVEFHKGNFIGIFIYNISGICMKSWQFQNNSNLRGEFELDLSDIPAGIYFCRVQIGNEMVTKKIIKVK